MEVERAETIANPLLSFAEARAVASCGSCFPPLNSDKAALAAGQAAAEATATPKAFLGRSCRNHKFSSSGPAGERIAVSFDLGARIENIGSVPECSQKDGWVKSTKHN